MVADAPPPRALAAGFIEGHTSTLLMRQDMINGPNHQRQRTRGLAFLVHTTFVFTVAPLLYWVMTCLQNLPFHFGMLVEASFGIPRSYVLCGLPLLAASAVSAWLGLLLSKITSIWYRIGFGAVVGCLLGLALESYLLWELRDAQGYRTFAIPCACEGALIGLCSSGIWRLSCSSVAAVFK
jgi:hypothetical protein